MTSTASQRLRLDKQATGDNPDAWGDRLNGVIDLVDEAFGFAEIAVNGNVTLSTENFVSDQSRRMVLRLTGSGGFSVTIPAVEHMYYIDNRCAADVTLKTAITPGATVLKNTKRIAYCDGANVNTDTSATAPSATDVAFNPSGSIAATNVQSAIAELDSEKQGALGFTPVRQGGGANQGINTVYIGWDGVRGYPRIQIDGSDLGQLWASGNGATQFQTAWFIKYPNGWIEQGNFLTVAQPEFTPTFPLAFPNACLGVIAGPNFTPATNVMVSAVAQGWTQTTTNILCRSVTSGGTVSPSSALPIVYRAWGY